MGKTASPHFSLQATSLLADESVTALAAVDVDGDGLLDVVAGTQTSAAGGHLNFLKHQAGWTFDVTRDRECPRHRHVALCPRTSAGPSVATSRSAGGRARRASSEACGSTTWMPAPSRRTAWIPSAGELTNWVPAVNANDFNYGIESGRPRSRPI